MTNSDFSIVFYLGALLLSLLAFGIVFFVVRYTAKQREHRHNKALMEQQFQVEISRVQFEVAEHTIKRISREIHDNICQSLLVSCHQLDREITRNENQQELKNIRNEVMASLNALRELSHSLSNHRLDNGLLDAVKLELSRISSLFGIKTNLVIQNEQVSDLGTSVYSEWETDLIFYRCFQEIVSNIIKHSKCTEVHISLAGGEEGWRMLSVKDNGVGMDSARIHQGLGLKHLQERMELLQGVLKIESTPDRGTTITLSL